VPQFIIFKLDLLDKLVLMALLLGRLQRNLTDCLACGSPWYSLKARE
jgi:hypothetical protein